MQDMDKFLAFVKSQSEFHDRQAYRLRNDDRRHKLHKGTSETFDELLVLLQSIVDENSAKSPENRRLALEWSELQNLPPELVAELSITDSDKLDFSIAELIEKSGGVATLDRILVDIYKLTGEILKRSNLNARLYRMVQKEMIYSVPGKKGVYSSSPISEEEADTLT